MPWKTIDFHGIANLDRSLVDHLTQFLDEKESSVGFGVLSLIRSVIDGTEGPLILPAPSVPVRLSESIESCARRMKEMLLDAEPPISFEEWRLKVVERADMLIWEYVEILESGVTELFEQLSHVPLEQWNNDLFQVVGEVKVLLMHHIEDTIWAIRRLDEMFWDYRWRWESLRSPYAVVLKKVVYRWHMLLDRSLVVNLEKSRKFLTFHYKKFSSRYRDYLKLKMRSEQSSQKFNGYHVFNLKEPASRERLVEIFQLLKIWNLNKTSKALPKELLKRAISNAFGFNEANGLFKDYARLLENAIYERSRIFKKLAHEVLFGDQGIALQQDVIGGYRAEVHTLWTMLSRYREFLLLTDPNPYIRTRWGFSEWTVGPEPKKTQQLLELEYKLEHMDHQLTQLQKAVDAGPGHAATVRDVKEDVYRWLHELSQPLISKNMMRVNAERIIESLQELNELGSFEPKAVDFVGDVLAKALRADWKYHVLFDLSQFEQIYRTHCGIVGEVDDRQHINRLKKFEGLVDQLASWVKTRTLNKHTHEIEQDMNDIKEGLQEFYAYVQRLYDDERLPSERALEHISEIGHGLLEYRFLFGKFFHELHENEPDERSIRNRFLFVDQYFESIESKIQEFYAKVLRSQS